MSRSKVDVGIAVVGAGLVGRQHVRAIAHAQGARLAALVDPEPSTTPVADELGVPLYADIRSLPRAKGIDAVLLATPNGLHVEHGLYCVAEGWPLLVEKPIADRAEDAARLVAAVDQAGIPLLVGHHRRHNPLVAEAKRLIDSGRLGRIVSVHATCWLSKPDDYFESHWRRQPGGGPVLVNLIHDVDVLRHLCGDVEAVHAIESSAVRGFAVEDTSAVLLQFQNGAIGTMSLSDTIAAPWSWELSAGENPAYPRAGEAAYLIGGSEASLSLPDIRIWQHHGNRGWWAPISATAVPIEQGNALVRQIEQFVAVVRGEAAPLVSGRDGLAALRVVEAIKQAAQSGSRVSIEA